MVSKFAAEIIKEIESDNRTIAERNADHEKIRKIQRNMQRREMNRTLSELCGVSARAAREDMGL